MAALQLATCGYLLTVGNFYLFLDQPPGGAVVQLGAK